MPKTGEKESKEKRLCAVDVRDPPQRFIKMSEKETHKVKTTNKDTDGSRSVTFECFREFQSEDVCSSVVH